MMRQYYTSPFRGGDNPLRVGCVAVGTIFRLPNPRDRYTPWILEAFLNGQCMATAYNRRTGCWEDRYLSRRSDTVVIRSLADGNRTVVALRWLLHVGGDEGAAASYPDLPDVDRYHGAYRRVAAKARSRRKAA
ncbi:hypothetical protein HLH33_13725 [Gluconacetobacter diazotrophicus]|uniref:Uncharacterized protein n=1 Tax=Gluconacetobacter diazotrophicus TaxID=33996 RepID=A0A7W4I6V3_GLUDI|nr:hypothetical protein [Gluconacetobacter diazotrophicus]MBB2157358.1 hypothetical protein [Gluconacetobacter diazotrophicus]